MDTEIIEAIEKCRDHYFGGAVIADKALAELKDLHQALLEARVAMQEYPVYVNSKASRWLMKWGGKF